MSFRSRQRAKFNEPANNRRLIDSAQSAINAPIPTFVDRVSQDNRRVYRAEIAIEPPSPVKRQNAARQALLDSQTRLAALEETFTFDRYSLDLGDSLDDGGGPNISHSDPKPVKPVVPSVSLSSFPRFNPYSIAP
ncbi:hypothetical protein B0H16DRAFT_1752377 [Mycena metata]|uniref:Uncharacterized protein n=1 Tax=Mycena metata TaxID=1033252 RepID=A0AAD7DGE3_9AGAR|nr:hypothetical protein B0H16DRAFT_1752377 [Mycena metata]